MEFGEVVTLTAVLVGIVAILISIFALMWQMRSQNDRLIERLSEEIKSHGENLTEVQITQAKLEGANGILNQILRQQSHTHQPGD